MNAITAFLLTLAAAFSAAPLPNGNATLPELRAYRSWTRVIPEPVTMAPPIAVLCAPATAAVPKDTANPHANKFFTVYVNHAGREAMMNKLTVNYPKGTVIVKMDTVII